MSSSQKNSKSSIPADAKEVQKDAKDFEKEDATETGKMIEEERAETGRVRTLEWSLIIVNLIHGICYIHNMVLFLSGILHSEISKTVISFFFLFCGKPANLRPECLIYSLLVPF